MQHTQNYQLSRWEKDDRIMMEDFNADNAKLDAALAAKADAEDVTALGETVAAVAAALGSGGQNARIAWGSYTGNGKAGSANPVRLNFDFTPVVVAVVEKESYSYEPAHLIKGQVRGVFSGSTCLLTWSGNSVSWYNPDGNANYQMNTANIPYCYMAIGY